MKTQSTKKQLRVKTQVRIGFGKPPIDPNMFKSNR